ncbi:MAG: DUF47 domain-containing protein [Chloroflexi bacterium]|nr:DUF47 domain-containing protein [Chloroflexota bacterium]
MNLSFLPREERFFGLLRSSARILLEISQKLVDLMEHYENVADKIAEIKRLEEAGDHVIGEIMRNLHRTFVTPLDREDIALLADRLDDVIDAIEETCRNLREFNIPKPTEHVIELARIIQRSAEILEQAVSLLKHKGARLKEILPHTVEVNRLENEADHVTSMAIAELFNSTAPPIEILKWREIYNNLELATDLCEDAANVLEGIVLKNA